MTFTWLQTHQMPFSKPKTGTARKMPNLQVTLLSDTWYMKLFLRLSQFQSFVQTNLTTLLLVFAVWSLPLQSLSYTFCLVHKPPSVSVSVILEAARYDIN